MIPGQLQKNIPYEMQDEKIREAHKQMAKDFGYFYDEELDQCFITVNQDPTLIPVAQKYNSPKDLEPELKEQKK